MAQNQVGQPADVIAVKNGIPVLIDCKECETNRFPLSRIEGNQEGAMTLWEQTGNEHCYFAMKLKDGRIYMVSFDELMLRQLYGEGRSLKRNFLSTRPFDSGWRNLNDYGNRITITNHEPFTGHG